MKRKFSNRSILAAAHDAVVSAISFVLAIYLRLGSDYIHIAGSYIIHGTAAFTIICFTVFTYMRLYSGIWRFASMHDMVAITKSVSLAILIFAAYMFFANRLESMPRSVLIINWMLLTTMLALPRFAYRAMKDRRLIWEMTLDEVAKIPVLLVGISNLAEQFIYDMARDPRTPYIVIGILDEKQSRHNRTIQHVPIYGNIRELHNILKLMRKRGKIPHKILIADPDLSGESIQLLLKLADEAALSVARIPSLSDFKQHFDVKTGIKPIALEDLLGRPQAALDRVAMQKMIAGKRILITGAGGSIGTELSRQIISYNPEQILLFDSCEYNLYSIDREIRNLLANSQNKINNITVKTKLGDVRDEKLINQLFLSFDPEIVFHAAAIKHVTLAEDNPEEAILTNVFGTKNIVDSCLKHKVANMVMISTDKAVNPSCVMGATKALAEAYCHAKSQGSTRFITVRFGNVLGSTGSVVPLFQEQIAKKQAITVTHREATRYFMTMREAVELVLQAAAIGAKMADAGKHVFVLDMGNPIAIYDLAQQMIRLAGLKINEIPIIFTGLKVGEKLHEELLHAQEQQIQTNFQGIKLARSRVRDYSNLDVNIEKLRLASIDRDKAFAVNLLQQLIK